MATKQLQGDGYSLSGSFNYAAGYTMGGGPLSAGTSVDDEGRYNGEQNIGPFAAKEKFDPATEEGLR